MTVSEDSHPENRAPAPTAAADAAAQEPVRPGPSFVTPAFTTGGADQPAAYLRRTFHVPAEPVRATLRVTGLGIVESWINGSRVGDEVLSPGWTSYKHRLDVRTHDVTALVSEGENAFGAVVGEGWAAGRLGFEGGRNFFTDRVALWAELVVEHADGTTTVVTDSDFTASTGATLAHSLYDGETHDARLEPAGWSAPGFDDQAWSAVESFDWPTATLVETGAEPIRRIEELAPVSITVDGQRTIIDFGQLITGWVRLTVDGAEGDVITLRHAETLIHGEFDVRTLRTAKATDTYILRGGGTETWEPRFTFHGFRYLEITGYPGEVTADSVRAIVVHSDMRRTGGFESSDPLLNQLHANVVWGMRGNFVGVPTDCPQRDERLGWTGDINAFAPTAAFLYDVRGVLGSWLQDLAAEQADTGEVPWVVPNVLSTPCPPTALWSDVAVSLPWTMYHQYGDQDILERAYPSITAFVRQVEALLDEHGAWSDGFQFGDWLDPDAPANNPAGGKTDTRLVATAYFAKVAREASQTAALLGHVEDAEHFAALSARVREAFRAEYVTPRGRVVGESATAYALAIVFGLLDEDQKARAGDELAHVVAGAKYRISTGFAGTPLVTDALSSTGHLTEAYLLLTQTECPSFQYPVTQGATTIWERWDAIQPDGSLNDSGMTSLNHYALGAVADWMHRVVGGLSALEPGYERILVAPQPGGGLTSARVWNDTDRGRAEVAWRIEDGSVTVDVVVPSGSTARVELPLHPQGEVEEVGSGSHSWTYEVAEDDAVELDMDTPIGVLAGEVELWTRVQSVLEKHIPGVPIDASAPQASSISLRGLLGYIPHCPPELGQDLQAVLEGAEASSTAAGVR